MARFAYRAVDLAGQLVEGFIRAENENEARSALERRRLSPVRLAVQPADVRTRGPRVSLRSLSLVTRQLATLMRVAPIEESLRTIAQQVDRPKVRLVLNAVHASVLEGHRLSDAMAHQGEAFPAHYRAMIAAGEASGALPEILERLAELLDREQQARSRLLTALIYPACLAVTAIGVVIALMTFVVPKVVDQFESMGQTLPLLTRIVIVTSDVMRTWGWLGLLLLAAGGALAFRLLQHPGRRLIFDGLVLKTPGLGRLVRDQNAARLARTLSVMISAGAPVMEGLRLTARTINNRVLRKATEDMASAIREGGSLSTAIRRAGVFPPILVHMAASGEAGGQLQPMLTGAADYLDRELNTFTAVLLSLLEPGIIILMGALVAVIVLSILLPILQINTLTLR